MMLSNSGGDNLRHNLLFCNTLGVQPNESNFVIDCSNCADCLLIWLFYSDIKIINDTLN